MGLKNYITLFATDLPKYFGNTLILWITVSYTHLENIMKWVDQTKEYTDKGYNNKSSLGDSQWAADQGPTGKVIGFFYSTWGINFTLSLIHI